MGRVLFLDINNVKHIGPTFWFEIILLDDTLSDSYFRLAATFAIHT